MNALATTVVHCNKFLIGSIVALLFILLTLLICGAGLKQNQIN